MVIISLIAFIVSLLDIIAQVFNFPIGVYILLIFVILISTAWSLLSITSNLDELGDRMGSRIDEIREEIVKRLSAKLLSPREHYPEILKNFTMAERRIITTNPLTIIHERPDEVSLIYRKKVDEAIITKGIRLRWIRFITSIDTFIHLCNRIKSMFAPWTVRSIKDEEYEKERRRTAFVRRNLVEIGAVVLPHYVPLIEIQLIDDDKVILGIPLDNGTDIGYGIYIQSKTFARDIMRHLDDLWNLSIKVVCNGRIYLNRLKEIGKMIGVDNETIEHILDNIKRTLNYLQDRFVE